MISYSIKKLSAEKPIALKSLTELKDLVIQKAGKGSTVFVTECKKWLEGIKYLLLDSSKFMQLFTKEDKWINYINNLQSKIKNLFKVIQMMNMKIMDEDKLMVLYF